MPLPAGQDDHADVVFTELAKQACGEFDIAAQENAGKRFERDSAHAFAIFSKNEGFTIGFKFDAATVSV